MTSEAKPSWNVERRRRANLNEGKAPCQVSGRWLQFPAQAHEIKHGIFLAVDVMTADGDSNPRKLCELVLVKEDCLNCWPAFHTSRTQETQREKKHDGEAKTVCVEDCEGTVEAGARSGSENSRSS